MTPEEILAAIEEDIDNELARIQLQDGRTLIEVGNAPDYDQRIVKLYSATAIQEIARVQAEGVKDEWEDVVCSAANTMHQVFSLAIAKVKDAVPTGASMQSWGAVTYATRIGDETAQQFVDRMRDVLIQENV